MNNELDNQNEFIEKRLYREVLNDIKGKVLTNDSYEEPTEWTEEVQSTFNFIYDNALDLIIEDIDFDGELILDYNGNLFSFFEMHGQGCYQCISTIDNLEESEASKFVVKLKDLEDFVFEGKTPERLIALKSAFIGLDVIETLEAINVTVNKYIDNINVDEVRDYLLRNLK